MFFTSSSVQRSNALFWIPLEERVATRGSKKGNHMREKRDSCHLYSQKKMKKKGPSKKPRQKKTSY
jgi:hypothetical protein